MGYWQEKAASEGQANAPRLEAGDNQELEIVKIVFGKGTNAFTSHGGDAQIMVVYADSAGREGTEMFTLSEKAAWKLAKMVEAAGLNIAAMDERGIKPEKFAEQDFATKNLVGRTLRANVTIDRSNYHNFEYLRRQAAAAGSTDEIPL